MKKRGTSNKFPCSKCFLTFVILAVTIYILHSIFIFSPVFNKLTHLHNIVGNIFIVLLSLTALIATLRMYFKMPTSFPRENKGNLFLAISLLLFFIGDVLWLISEVFYGSLMPIGGYPDLAWNLAYFALIISLIYYISVGFRPWNNRAYWVLLIVAIIGIGILYGDVSEDLAEGSFTSTHALQDMYILYDILVLLLIFYLVWPLFSSDIRFGLHWIIFGVGMISRLVYDQIFVQMSQDGTYYTGHPVDLLYVSLYLFIVIGFYIKSKQLGVIK